MAVTWSTQLLANDSYVEYSLSNDTWNLMENATMSKFIDGSSAHRVLYMYRAVLKKLTMNTTYGKRSYLFDFYMRCIFSLSCWEFIWLECEIFISNNT